MKGVVACLGLVVSLPALAGDLPTFAGPAMGTTYRVTLARAVPGMSLGEVHREVEDVLARLDRALSTWRPDSDASRFNAAKNGEWIDVAPDLVAVVSIARSVHDDTGGAFDITASAGRIGAMRQLDLRFTPPALQKSATSARSTWGASAPAMPSIRSAKGSRKSAHRPISWSSAARSAFGAAAGSACRGASPCATPPPSSLSPLAKPSPRAPPAPAARPSIPAPAASWPHGHSRSPCEPPPAPRPMLGPRRVSCVKGRHRNVFRSTGP